MNHTHVRLRRSLGDTAAPRLRALFSEEERRQLWRAVWVALAQAQARAGLITDAEVADLRAHAHEIDSKRRGDRSARFTTI